MSKKFLLIIFLFPLILSAQEKSIKIVTYDSLFIADCKKFIYKELGTELDSSYFTKRNYLDKPYIYIYVSRPDMVAAPEDNGPFTTASDDAESLRKTSEMEKKGLQTMCYKTNANASTHMNNLFLAYPHEAIAFIMFHELTHNYQSYRHLSLPYEFNEAISDVIGNYGALKYAEETSKVDLKAVKHQLKTNEKIYACINLTTDKVNRNQAKQKIYHEKCYKTIRKILKHGNQFQKDRFDYTVNNAYLLRYSNYCKNYFLLKDVLMKEGSIKGLLEEMKHAVNTAGTDD